MTSATDDALLVAAAVEGGVAGQLAFEQLVDRHQQWLVRLLVHLLGSTSDAEDIAQEVFVRAYLAIEDCTDRARFRGWLRVVARRLAFNHRRDARVRTQYEQRTGELTATSVEPIAPRLEGREQLERALAGLSYPYREIMVLRFVEELSLKSIAEVLEIGESAAKMRLFRAREEFQRNFEKLGGRHGDDTGRA